MQVAEQHSNTHAVSSDAGGMTKTRTGTNNQPLRILMLSQFYPPIIGGEERFVRDFSTELAARGHQVSVATLWQDGLPFFEMDGAVRVHRVRSSMRRVPGLRSDEHRQHAPPLPDPEAMWALRHIIAREQPQIVHAHNWMIHSFLPLKAWSGAKLVLTLHDYSLACAKKKLMYGGAPCSGPGLTKCLGCASEHYGAAKGVPTVLSNWGMGVVERAAVDMVLPESQAVAEGNGLIGSSVPYRVLPVFVPDTIGVPHGDSSAYMAQLPDEYVLFVGAFGSYKGIDVLVHAYNHLTDAPPLVIIGYETAEYPVATTDFPPNVHVFKNWPHHAVMDAWRRSTLGVVPSVWAEPFGLVALEAMASGRAVIASNIGGLRDIVMHEETGLLVPPGDAEALRAALARLLADQALRERLGQAGQERVTLFQTSTVLPQIEQVYRQLITPKRSVRR